MIERSYFAWKTGHPTAFWFRQVSGSGQWTLGSQELGSAQFGRRLRSYLVVAWGKGTSWRTKYDTASLLFSSRMMKMPVELKKVRGKRERGKGKRKEGADGLS